MINWLVVVSELVCWKGICIGSGGGGTMFAAAAEMRGSPEVKSQSIVAFVVQAPAKRETAKAGSER
ncbi:MAG: hypothetical protein ACK562_13040, partial [Acidobacteriota bacterium]